MDADVLIVGAGPGGAALALLLASRGVQTILLERQHDFGREFRGEVMMPSGLRVLEEIGVDLEKLPHQRPEVFQGYRLGRRFIEIDMRAVEGLRPLTVSQPHLLEHLVSLAEETSRFRFVRGGTVRDLVREGDRVCGVRVQTNEGERHLSARLVVGADGRASVARRRSGVRVHARGAAMDIVWFKLPWPGDWSEPQLRGYVGGGHLLIALPAPDGMLQVAWVILKGTYGELRARGIEEWARSMAEHVDSELGEYLRAHTADITRPFLLASETDCVESWAGPGLLLIGDAAHTMSPVGGQGLNLALRDAVVAANQLVPAFRAAGDDAALDRAAQGVERERQPEISRIQGLAALPPRILMGRSSYHTALRWAIARLLGTTFGQSRARPVAELFLNGVTQVALRV